MTHHWRIADFGPPLRFPDWNGLMARSYAVTVLTGERTMKKAFLLILSCVVLCSVFPIQAAAKAKPHAKHHKAHSAKKHKAHRVGA